MNITINGQQRVVRFNNFALEQFVNTCANGEYSSVGAAVESLLAQSRLIFAAHIIDASLKADDLVYGRVQSHTFQDIMVFISTSSLEAVLSIIEEFTRDMQNLVPQKEEARSGTDIPETPKKKYRGQKS